MVFLASYIVDYSPLGASTRIITLIITHSVIFNLAINVSRIIKEAYHYSEAEDVYKYYNMEKCYYQGIDIDL